MSRTGASGAEVDEVAAPRETDRGILGVLPPLVWVIAGVLVLVLLALADAYGFHRDDMYFIIH